MQHQNGGEHERVGIPPDASQVGARRQGHRWDAPLAVLAEAREQVIHRRVNYLLGFRVALDYDIGPPHSLPCLLMCFEQPLIARCLCFFSGLARFLGRRFRIERRDHTNKFGELVGLSLLDNKLYVERGLLEAWRKSYLNLLRRQVRRKGNAHRFSHLRNLVSGFRNCQESALVRIAFYFENRNRSRQVRAFPIETRRLAASERERNRDRPHFHTEIRRNLNMRHSQVQALPAGVFFDLHVCAVIWVLPVVSR